MRSLRSLNHLSNYISTVSPFRICFSAGHGKKTGTNLYAALRRVNEMISYFKRNSAKNHFNETQNIIIIETDGDDTRNVSQTRAGKPFSTSKKLFYSSFELFQYLKRELPSFCLYVFVACRFL